MCFTPEIFPDKEAEVFRIRPTVKAVRIREPFEVRHRDGKTHMCRDGWVVMNDSGDVYAVTDSIFASVYEPV
jgi:hypothetical protein